MLESFEITLEAQLSGIIWISTQLKQHEGNEKVEFIRMQIILEKLMIVMLPLLVKVIILNGDIV